MNKEIKIGEQDLFRCISSHVHSAQSAKHWTHIKLHDRGTSSQDNGLSKCGSPPLTTTSNLPLKYRTNITHNQEQSS